MTMTTMTAEGYILDTFFSNVYSAAKFSCFCAHSVIMGVATTLDISIIFQNNKKSLHCMQNESLVCCNIALFFLTDGPTIALLNNTITGVVDRVYENVQYT